MSLLFALGFVFMFTVFFGHPEVYILIIPGFGVISTKISASSNKNVFAFYCLLCAARKQKKVTYILSGHMLLNILSGFA